LYQQKLHFAREPHWFAIETTASLLESTNGKDKLLKLAQYAIKLCVEVIKKLNEHKMLGSAASQILAKAAIARIIAKQMSTGRKLFRFGRSVYCILMIRTLLEEKNTFLQVVGLNSWFWNSLWFICDHSQWLLEIGVIKKDPFLSLNKLAAVLMQVFQFLFNTRTLSLYIEEENKLLEELEQIKTKRRSGNRSKSLDEANGSTGSLKETPILGGTVDQKALMDPVARIEGELKLIQKKKFNLIPTFLKTLGDTVICFDFGFGWGMPELWVNLAGVIGGIAGCYIEVETAISATNAKIKASEKSRIIPVPPRR